MKTFSFIFARGGSKGIKNKNIKSFCGKPLIEYSIKVAKEIDRIDECFVSTDSSKIAKISKCKKLVLTHFVPTKFNEKNLTKLIKKDYGKYPIIGKDLLTIKI